MKTHEYEIRAHYDNDKVVAKVWWDGDKVASDNTKILEELKGRNAGGYRISDGIKFLKGLPGLYNNGYMSARKVSK